MKIKTAEEFVKYYAENSGETVEEILEWRYPMPCDCENEICTGWQMKIKEEALQ
jgi:hypothetical protein